MLARGDRPRCGSPRPANAAMYHRTSQPRCAARPLRFLPRPRALAVIEAGVTPPSIATENREGLHGERGLRIDLQTGQEVRRLGKDSASRPPTALPDASRCRFRSGTLDQGSMSAGVGGFRIGGAQDRNYASSHMGWHMGCHGFGDHGGSRAYPVVFEVAEDEGPINTDGGAEMLQSPTQNGAIGGFIFKGRHRLPGTGHQCVRMSQLPAHQIVVGADGIWMRMSRGIGRRGS